MADIFIDPPHPQKRAKFLLKKKIEEAQNFKPETKKLSAVQPFKNFRPQPSKKVKYLI